jgi:hypothetical protein
MPPRYVAAGCSTYSPAQLCFEQQFGLERRRTEARGPLRSALATLERIGALPWAQRAGSELAATAGVSDRRKTRASTG